jgi:multiple sugar transport system substrate-binding protein
MEETNMSTKNLKTFGLLLVASLLLMALAAQCGAPAEPQVIEKIVTVEVEKEVEKVVEKEVEVEKVVTVEVEKEVEVEKVVTVEVEVEGAPAGDAASIAVEAAKQYAGTKIVKSYEAGLQAQDGYFFGKEWTALTGIEVEIVEVPFEDQFSTMMTDHLGGGGGIDLLDVNPAWMGDLAAAGVLEPLDPFFEKYYPADEWEDVHPVYRDNWSKVGDVLYALPDDGDIHILYYRKDLFEDPDNMSEFEAEYGYDLAPPETWDQWTDICKFFTEKYAPETYGCSVQHVGQAYHWFQSMFRSFGGEFFDPETMKATVNSEAGVKAAEAIVASLPYQPPGAAESQFITVFSQLMNGETAMAISWPPPGRWTQGYGSQTEQLAWMPATQVAGKIGYAEQPGGGELAAGFNLCVSADSPNKEAAYLFAQWLHSKRISEKRVMTPFALRDPYRMSHYDSALYKSQWSNADEYLEVLKEGAYNGWLNLTIPGSREYEEAEERAATAIAGGADIQATLDQLAAEWDEITERIGVDSQREAYLEWAARPNAYQR